MKQDLNQTNRVVALTPEKVIDLRTQYQRLVQLGQTKVRSKDMDAEQQGLANSLGTELLRHGDELLSIWLAFRGEYMPLVAGVASLFARAAASGMDLGQHAETAPDNVTPLK